MDEALYRVMSRRLLYGWQGLATRVDLAVLQAVEEGWYATRSAIADDIDCKEVRLAVAVQRDGALLMREGRAFTLVAIGPEHSGLAALKRLARSTAEAFAQAALPSVELAGYWHDDRHPELRRVFALIYRARPAQPLPDAQWAGSEALSADPLAPLFAPAFFGAA
ncbi:MAG: hypothetical protein N3B15_06095 [Planctomycetota bacterium]|nr:hypothetical protein [Planctomycetota bacterium]MCX8040125.1 hypothetical protein [Planctomycetota bacterium]